MKKLMTVLMCFQFIIAPVAIAQTTSGSTDSKTANNGDQFRANPDAKPKGASYTKQILGLGIGIVAANAIVTCATKIHPSVMIFGAGGVIYIMSELLGGKAHNDYLKKTTADLKMVQEKMKSSGGVGEVQKASLEAALANEKQILSFIKKRKMWFMAISAIFTAATIAAAIEWLTPTPLAPVAVIPAGCVPNPAVHSMTASGLAAAFSFASGGGMMGSFAAALLLYVKGTGTAVTAAMNSNPGRVGIFAVSTGIVASIMGDLSAKAGVAQNNVNLLQKALDEFKANSTPTNGIATGVTSGPNSGSGSGDFNNPNGTKNNAITMLPTSPDANSKICASSSSQGVSISSSACASPLKVQAPAFDAALNVPTLNSVGQTTSEVGNALANGNLAAAEIGAGQLASQAGRLEQMKNDLLKQVNAKLAANGKKGLDLNATANEQSAALMGAIGKNDQGAANALSALMKGNGNVALGNDLKGDADLKENKQQINSTADSVAVKSTAVDPNAAASAALSAAGYGNGLNEGTLSAEDLAKKNGKSMDQALNEFESSESDISKGSDTSLFKQLSNRYLLNYNKIFERKKEDPVSVPNKK
jgi:hypothetical protein